MTVKELIEFLQTCPEDASVRRWDRGWDKPLPLCPEELEEWMDVKENELTIW